MCRQDQVLLELDWQVAELTRQCLHTWTDCVAARRRRDWDEVERLQDLADTLSAAADAAQAKLDREVHERVHGRKTEDRRRLLKAVKV